jgi:hypothetical protein
MEIISIEKITFEEMMMKFEYFTHQMELICAGHREKKMSDWMDNQDVCCLLNISPRTLQTLRDNGTLAYSQINHKTFYLPEDVQKIIPVLINKGIGKSK